MANGDAKPVTYKGYDSDDKFVYEQTGQNADQYIDMKVVKAKMSDIYDAMNTNLKNISDKLEKYSSDSEEAIYVDGANMKKPIENLITDIGTVPSAIEGDLAEVEVAVAKAHDDLQGELNTAARNEVKNYPGVSRVS